MVKEWHGLQQGWSQVSQLNSQRTSGRKIDTDTGCSLKIVFFTNSMQPISYICRRATHLIWDLSVQSLLLAGHFLYNQPSAGEGEAAKYLKFLTFYIYISILCLWNLYIYPCIYLYYVYVICLSIYLSIKIYLFIYQWYLYICPPQQAEKTKNNVI